MAAARVVGMTPLMSMSGEVTRERRRTRSPWRNPRRTGYVLGSGLMLASLTALVTNQESSWTAKGPMNAGHEDLSCASCHDETQGSLRQQVQANVSHILGRRDSVVWVGRQPVTNQVCLDCHPVPDDRHPTFRFFEPRFADAREEVGAHRCNACHQEHQGRRVARGDFCGACHEDIELSADPIDPSHRQLAADDRWSSCLGCHDFHGNHDHRPQQSFAERFGTEPIEAYLEGGPSPYGDRIERARSER